MHFVSLLVLSVSACAALPSVAARAEDSIWKAKDGKGNIKVYFSDTNINWGDWEPSTWLEELSCDSARVSLAHVA